MNNSKKQTSISKYIKLEDYKAFDYEIPEIYLDFVIKKNVVNVVTQLKLIKKNKNTKNYTGCNGVLAFVQKYENYRGF